MAVDTRPICGFSCDSCKNGYVVLQKLDKRVFLFRIQSGSDERRLLEIIVDQLDFFVLLGLNFWQ